MKIAKISPQGKKFRNVKTLSSKCNCGTCNCNCGAGNCSRIYMSKALNEEIEIQLEKMLASN